jgi:uncharacterized membrane protein
MTRTSSISIGDELSGDKRRRCPVARILVAANVPVGVLLVALAASRLPRNGRSGHDRQQLDLVGAVTVTGGLVALVWALTRSDSSGEVLGALTLATVLLGAFAAIETRGRAPLVPFAVAGSFRGDSRRWSAIPWSEALWP